MKGLLRLFTREQRQSGFMLLTLIASITVMAAITAAAVKLTSSSNYGEQFANNYNLAYYIAESGGRYALPRVVKDKAQAKIDLDNQTFTIGGLTYSLQVDTTSVAPDTIVTSTGKVNQGLSNQSQAVIRYRVIAAIGGGSGDETTVSLPITPTTTINDFDTSGSWAVDQSNQALKVTAPPPGGGAGKDATAALKVLPSGICTAWTTGYKSVPYCLQYDIQAKIWATDNKDNYLAGLIFNMTGVSANGNNQDGLVVSFMRSPGNGSDGISFDNWNYSKKTGHTNIPALENSLAVILWAASGHGAGKKRDLLAYKILDASSNMLDSNGQLRAWATLMVRITETKPGSTKQGAFKVYMGDNATVASGNTSVVDYTRKSITPLHAAAVWPTREDAADPYVTTAATDYFTLVNGWTLTPEATDFSLSNATVGSTTYATNAVFSTTTTTFLTASAPDGSNDPCATAIFGLHSAGSSATMPNYFSDFAVKYISGTGSGVGGGIVQY